MVVLINGRENQVVFTLSELTDEVNTFNFTFKNRTDSSVVEFSSKPISSTYRADVFSWNLVLSKDKANPDKGLLYLKVGQYDYYVTDLNGKLVESGLLRVEGIDAEEPITHTVIESFKVYNG